MSTTDNGNTKTSDQAVEGKWIPLSVQPSSMLIRMMADAFYHVFDDQSRMLVEYRGVTIVKAAADLKARIAYSSVGN